MSLRDRKNPAALLLLGLLATAVSSCTVKPLYMKDAPTAQGEQSGIAADLASIEIKPVTTRYAQEVRNELIFLLGGGAGEAKAPRYDLTLNVASWQLTTAVTPAADVDSVNVPSAAVMTLTAHYVITDAASNKVVAKGTRSITSSIDVPRQQYAAQRAENDAQKRAAGELAQLLRLSIAQDLTRVGGK